MTNEDFYEKCALLLETSHEGQPFTHYKRTRWNNRIAGRGRYPGRGIVRVFGDQVQIALYDPPIHRICSSKEEAISVLETLN